MLMIDDKWDRGILERFKNSLPVDRVYSSFFGTLHAALYRLSPVLTARHRYRLEMGRALRLDHPVTFDEKLFWLMLYWHHPLKSQCTDKYGMRAYAESRGYGRFLVELLGVYDEPSGIDFAALPAQFVLKCTHGCGFNIFCRDKASLDLKETRRQLGLWMKQDYARCHGEVQYADIKPRILAETWVDAASGTLPIDYKLHCFHGRVHFTTVCTARLDSGHGGFYDHFDRDWQNQMAISRLGVHTERWHPRPECYPVMVEVAEALAEPFPYVRVDFYCVGGATLLGEMTFTPAGCIDPEFTEEAELHLGELIHLPDPIPPAARGAASMGG